MNHRRLLHVALLLAIAGGALFIRAALPAGHVFRDGYVSFQDDAAYHMRVVDHLVANFPHRLTVDPYASPDGQFVAIAPLFDYLIATIALIAGGGSPSVATVERAGALVPVGLGALAVVLVYLIGRRLFDPRAGLVAAALLAVMPGPFLMHTLVGAADHHAAEAALLLLTLLAVVVTVQKIDRDAGMKAWRNAAAYMAGVSLGLYCLAWTSAALFIGAFGLWVTLQTVIDERLERSTTPLARHVVLISATALAVVLMFQNPHLFRFESQVAALAGLILIGGAARVGESLRVRVAWRRITPLAAIIAAAALAAAAGALLYPSLVSGVLLDVTRLEPKTTARFVSETQPLLALGGRYSWLHPWYLYGPAFYVGLAGLAALATRVRETGSREHALLLVSSLAALVAALGQVRFGYYLAPLLTIVVGWLCSWLWSRFAGWRRAAAATAIAALMLSTLQMGVAAASRDPRWSDALRRALLWLRQHTPEPFDDPGYYLAPYADAPSRAPYSVMNWADDGYQVLRVARRVPVSNPTQEQIANSALFFTSTHESDALARVTQAGSRYVLLPRDLILLPTRDATTLYGKFESLTHWADVPTARFVEGMFERGDDGELKPAWIFHPDYYQSMAVRLYVYGGRGAEPDNDTWVITYADRRTPNGGAYREIVSAARYARYADAAAALEALGPGPHRLVGRDPLRTAVPLEPVTAFTPLHDEREPGSPLPAVRIFAVSKSDMSPPPEGMR